MKTKLRKLIVAPMIALTLCTAFIPTARADIFQQEVTTFCYVNVITRGGITQAIGQQVDCTPAFSAWCRPKGCMAISTPVQ